MNKNQSTGEIALRARIASELVQDGTPAQQAEQQATQAMLAVRASGPGEKVVEAGNTVFIVSVKEN